MHVKGLSMSAIDLRSGPATPIPPSGELTYPCAGHSGYPSHLVQATTLRDGTSLTIRPICSDDYALELDFIRRLSARSGYQRLLSPRKLTSHEIRRFVDIDYARELALIALAVVDNQVRQIGVARYAPEHDGLSHDFGIVVADEWQGRGLGEALLRSLVSAAADAGVQHLTGLTLAENHTMRRLAHRLGFDIESEPGDATVVQLRKALSGEQNGRRGVNAVAFAFDQQDVEVGGWDSTDIWMS